jgi:hypothetical protein
MQHYDFHLNHPAVVSGRMSFSSYPGKARMRMRMHMYVCMHARG